MKSARYPIRPCIANRFRLVDAADESIGQPADSSRDASRRSRNLSALHPSKGRPESLRRHPPAREPRHRAKPMSRICRARSSHRNTGNEPATVALDNAGHRSFWHLPRAAFAADLLHRLSNLDPRCSAKRMTKIEPPARCSPGDRRPAQSAHRLSPFSPHPARNSPLPRSR